MDVAIVFPEDLNVHVDDSTIIQWCKHLKDTIEQSKVKRKQGSDTVLCTSYPIKYSLL